MSAKAVTCVIVSRIDQEDLDAALDDYTDHYLRFGETPPPHQKRAADANLKRIAANIQECVQVEVHEG